MRRRWRVAAGIVGILAVIPGVSHHYPVPPLVDVARGASCYERTVKFKYEQGALDKDQYRGQTHVYFCTNDRHTKVVSKSVSMTITYVFAGWEVTGSDSSGYWKPWNGHFHGSRVEIRQKTLKLCPGIGPLNTCVETKHPHMTVEMRASGQMLVYDYGDLKITGIVCNTACG